MLRCLFICLLAVGCSGNSATQTTQAVQSKAEKRVFKPSELVDMDKLPSGIVTIRGKVLAKDTDPNSDGTLWLEVENRENKAERDDKTISVRFSPGEKGFSQGLLKWFLNARQGWMVEIEATVERLEKDTERKVYAYGKQIN